MTAQEYDFTIAQIEKMEADIILKLQTHLRALVGKWALGVLLSVSIASYVASANWNNLQSRVFSVEKASAQSTIDVNAFKNELSKTNDKLTEISTDMRWIKENLNKK